MGRLAEAAVHQWPSPAKATAENKDPFIALLLTRVLRLFDQ